MPAPWKEDVDCGSGYHRERGSDFVFCGRREKEDRKKKKKKKKKAFSGLKERETER
jgi:hypothetical protein